MSPLVITTVCKFVFGICLIANVGIVTLVSELQPSNALLPIEVTLLPIVTLVSPLQSANATEPIEVTLSGIVTLVSPLQL